MSWVTVALSMTASSCLTLALMHGFIWCRQRDVLANLLFTLTALGAAAVAGCELIMMRAETTAEFGSALRWAQVGVWVIILSLAWFVRFYLQAGRLWLCWTVCVLRTLSLIANFLTGENLNFREITRLRHLTFLGERISVAEGLSNPWMLAGQLSMWLLVIFVADAAITVWRRGKRRQALVGGLIAFSLVAGAVEMAVVVWGMGDIPIIVSLFYLGFLAAMGHELSCEALRAPRLAHELRESEKRMAQAAEAANVGIWFRDLAQNEIWCNDQWRELLGFAHADRPDIDRFFERLHPDDRAPLRHALREAMEASGVYEMEYRVMLPEGGLRWIASRGRVEFNNGGNPVRVGGVSLDITHRKQAELEAQSHRNEVAHLLRVASLGELSSALAHELNQPLTAILSNAQAAQRFLAQDQCDLTEIHEILRDIVADDQRAGEIISRLRTLLKKGEFQPQALGVNHLIQDVLKLMNGDLTAREVSVVTKFAAGLPPIWGDRVQLQQVLINLVLNAGDAMSQQPAGTRTLTLGSSRHDGNSVLISVADTGGGFPPGDEERIFEPYHTTKEQGLGLGLSLSRSILMAHGGRAWAENSGQGASFSFTLPEWKGSAV